MAILITNSWAFSDNSILVVQFDNNLLAVTVIVSILFIGLLIWAIILGQKRRVETGVEGMIGKIAVVRTRLAPKGTVMVDGEIWMAKLDKGTAEIGDEVIIRDVEELKLKVTKNNLGE